MAVVRQTKKMNVQRLAVVVVTLWFAMITCGLRAETIIDFENFSDGTFVTTQFAGLTFSDAEILTAGISLNQFEFPPHSGLNVVADIGGPISISFATPITDFGGYFNYLERLTIRAFDSQNNLLNSVQSHFSDNLACLAGPPCLGDAGSGPNEFLQLMSATDVSSITITGDAAGSSFTLDDMSYSSGTNHSSIPEPGTASLVMLAAVVVLIGTTRCPVMSNFWKTLIGGIGAVRRQFGVLAALKPAVLFTAVISGLSVIPASVDSHLVALDDVTYSPGPTSFWRTWMHGCRSRSRHRFVGGEFTCS